MQADMDRRPQANAKRVSFWGNVRGPISRERWQCEPGNETSLVVESHVAASLEFLSGQSSQQVAW